MAKERAKHVPGRSRDLKNAAKHVPGAPRDLKGATKRPPGRPRDLDAKEAVLRAARELLEQGGPGFVTMEAVASRAGVGKPTVYRWWPDRHSVVMAALMSADQQPATRSRGAGRSLDSLRNQLRQIATRFASPTGRHITAMLAAADPKSEITKAFRTQFVITRRAEGRVMIEQAMASGELRDDLDVDIALDELYGAMFFRVLVGHAPLDRAFIDALLAHVLEGMRHRAPRNHSGILNRRR